MAALPVLALGVALPATASAASRAAVPGTVPTWATAHNSRGSAPGSSALDVRVYLAGRDPAGLSAFVDAVSDPGSASYRHFLSQAQYAARFAPTSAQVSSVSDWLKSTGLTVTGVGAGNRYVAVHGSVAQAAKAFGTTFGLYAHKGQTVRAASHLATVPASLKTSVLTITGLDSADHLVTPHSQQPFPPPAGYRNAQPCSSYYGEKIATNVPAFQGSARPYAVCGYTPAPLRAAYGSPGLTGQNVTVAITDAYAAGTILQDANTYSSRHGEPPFASGQFSQSLPSSFVRQKTCDGSGWYGEETLDVEAVHAIAPAANVRYYAAASCFDSDFLDTLGKVVDENRASIVTNSWSDLEAVETPSVVAAYQQVFKQGAAQGIGFFFSSGDDGDENASSGVTQVDYPASDPYATAVGGTSLAVGRRGYSFEAGWGTDRYDLSDDGTTWEPYADDPFYYGAGGGVSALFPVPDWQKSAVPASTTGRAVPDVGLDGDPTTGMLIGETQTFPSKGKDVTMYDEYRLGGTSLASPLMAGVQALAQQAAGSRLGFANPAIYAQRGTSSFRDITANHDGEANVRADYVNSVDATDGVAYSVRTFDDDSSLQTGPGWDDVTGVGSPTASYATSYPH
jgi:subtilase family serine protease